MTYIATDNTGHSAEIEADTLEQAIELAQAMKHAPCRIEAKQEKAK